MYVIVTHSLLRSQVVYTKQFNLGSGVWIPYRRGIFKFWSD